MRLIINLKSGGAIDIEAERVAQTEERVTFVTAGQQYTVSTEAVTDVHIDQDDAQQLVRVM